jgi:hypothetical protein
MKRNKVSRMKSYELVNFCEIDKFALRKSNLKVEVMLCFTYLIRIIQAALLL